MNLRLQACTPRICKAETNKDLIRKTKDFGRSSARALLVFVLTSACWAASNCPWSAAGGTVKNPPALFSEHGKLIAHFIYQTEIDEQGQTRFCFKTVDGKESPTLYLDPGDELILRVTNLVPRDAPGLPQMSMAADGMELSRASGKTVCGAKAMTSASVNVHYHGTNVAPSCHSDEVIHTLINSNETFEYRIKFPADEPPGLYYYHPHVHGISEPAVLGGATGLIVIRGIQNLQPLVAGLPERLLVVRDYEVPGDPEPPAPAKNLSVNYVPVPYPNFPPAVIQTKPAQQEFWRVANTSADTILDLELSYDGKPQKLNVIALDGVPTGSHDGTRQGAAIVVDHIRVPTAGRVEFIITTPSKSVRKAAFLVREVETGPDGDNDPARPLAILNTSDQGAEVLPRVSADVEPVRRQRFEGLASAAVTATRKLYFSENPGAEQFFVTVEGQQPKLFSSDNPPAIMTHQGAVEDWTIENRALENHEFHIHQLHFLVMAKNGVPVPASEKQFLDTVDIPFWSGSGPYPSVMVRLDFRGADVGDFVYHCHILEHEDGGMMAIVRVLR